MADWYKETNGGIELRVKVVPGSSRDRIGGLLGNALKVQVAAAPERGKANDAVEMLLAQALDIDRRWVSVVSGLTSPRKVVRIEDVTAETVAMLAKPR